MKFRIGALYEIHFKDHTVGIRFPVECKAVGYVVEDNKEFVLLTPWWPFTDDMEIFNSNIEEYVVLKVCITKKRLL